MGFRTEGDEWVITYIFGKRAIEVYGCWDEETPEGTYEWYDLYEDGCCINEGSCIYSDTTPTYEEVQVFLD